ncbi:MAG: hypothetical protein O7C67_08715 [Gammaproteobacteria bacterium]|nr:hypothetical protein [Gammaproteobacteria bacterium]
MDVSAFCICTVVTAKAIESLLEGSGQGSYRDAHPWLVARDLLAAASEADQALPILFATGEPLTFSHWSILTRIEVVELHRGQWETNCDFTRLQGVNPIFADLDSVFLKPPDEQLARERLEGLRHHRFSLDETHVRPYAICETPPYIATQ